MQNIVQKFVRVFRSRRWVIFTIAVCIASVNTVLLFFFTPASDSPHVKGLRISQEGSLIVNVPGLVAPAHGPPGDFMNQPVLSHDTPKFTILPKRLCSHGVTELLVAVSSDAINFERRKRTRARFKVGVERDEKVRLVFFLSIYPNFTGLQQIIRNEADAYGDIAQLRAVESYRNLTLKSVAILYWATKYCSKATYVLKQDDDVKLNAFQVIRALYDRSAHFDHFIVGNSKILVESPIRDELSKYYTSREEFGDSFYPMFAHGPGYAFPMATGRLLYQASLRTRFFWLEDVYITGLCAYKAGVPVFFDQRFVLNEDWGNAVS